MRRLVHQNGEAGVHRAHEHEGDHVAPPLVDPHRAADDQGDPEPHGRHRHGVAHVVDAAQLGPQLGERHPVGQQPLARQDVGPVGRRRAPWCLGHACHITIDSQVTQESNSRHDGAPGPETPPRRPLTARSVLASALLGMDPPELPVAQLVRLTALFGISENRARVALSRMVSSGEATSDGAGRYRPGRAPRRAPVAPVGQPLRSDRALRRPWWLAVVTTAGSTAEVRGARRRALAYARSRRAARGRLDAAGQPRPAAARALEPDVETDDGTARGPTTSRPPVGPRGVVGAGGRPAWRLDQLDPDRPEALAPGFELSASVLRHLQSDPFLPPELLPAGWPGAPCCGSIYDDWDARYRGTLREWSRAR